jgi:hypothetical protein
MDKGSDWLECCSDLRARHLEMSAKRRELHIDNSLRVFRTLWQEHRTQNFSHRLRSFCKNELHRDKSTYTGDSHYTRGLCSCESSRRKRVERKTYNTRHFDVKLAPGFRSAKFITCITFPDRPKEVSTQVIGFKIWPRIGYWCSSWYWNKTVDIRKRG